MKCFNIPGIYDHFYLNNFILNLYYDHREMFKDDVKITSVFGNFPFCVWDGGRNFQRYHQCSKEEIHQISEAYFSLGVPLRFIFTNPEVEEKHLYNRYCNMILRECHSEKNEIVVNSPILEEYIRKNYPLYKIISSTTKRMTNKNEVAKELQKDYFQVCLDYDLNKDKELIENIPMENRKKIEFLINAICPAKCPLRKEHYSQTGRYHLSYMRERYEVAACGIKDASVHPNVLGKNNNFTNEEIDEYNKMGYQYFKIEGRTLPSADILGMYLYYMIKPEWYWDVISRAARIEGIFYNAPNDFIEMEVKTPRIFTMQKPLI